MLNACLRVLRSERGRKTKHRMHKQNFWKQGPRLNVDFPARADPWGLQKYWICQIYARSRTLALERKASLHGSPRERELPRSSGHHICRKYWEHEFLARTAVFPLERTSKFWKIQNMLLSFNLMFKGSKCMILAQTSHIHLLTWYKHQITTQWSSISQFNHMHVSN